MRRRKSSNSNTDLRRWFDEVDRSRTGQLNATELQEALMNNDHTNFDIHVIIQMIDMFDVDKTKQISFEEFQQLWAYLGNLRDAFNQFDVDKGGAIDAIKQLGFNLSRNFINVLMAKFDFSGDGFIQFDGFVMLLIKIKQLTAAFQEIFKINKRFA
ncbi:unnamed protein product [Oikopleura dioica]|uniref:EF-hand domain-containing protein n=1 Tax=Oikopleura dioica TaxID=34765 RepID=E4WW05_OIKDI|nr:unnamed protein product [Oikopleura dioica]